MSSSSSGRNAQGRHVAKLDLDKMQDYVLVKKRIKEVRLIKRYLGNQVFSHWALLFETAGPKGFEHYHSWIYFEYTDSGIHIVVEESYPDAKRAFAPNDEYIYYRLMKNFDLVPLSEIIERVRELEEGRFGPTDYDPVTNNCQDFVRALAADFDSGARSLGMLANVIPWDSSACAKELDTGKWNRMIGMTKEWKHENYRIFV